MANRGAAYISTTTDVDSPTACTCNFRCFHALPHLSAPYPDSQEFNIDTTSPRRKRVRFNDPGPPLCSRRFNRDIEDLRNPRVSNNWVDDPISNASIGSLFEGMVRSKFSERNQKEPWSVRRSELHEDPAARRAFNNSSNDLVCDKKSSVKNNNTFVFPSCDTGNSMPGGFAFTAHCGESEIEHDHTSKALSVSNAADHIDLGMSNSGLFGKQRIVFPNMVFFEGNGDLFSSEAILTSSNSEDDPGRLNFTRPNSFVGGLYNDSEMTVFPSWQQCRRESMLSNHMILSAPYKATSARLGVSSLQRSNFIEDYSVLPPHGKLASEIFQPDRSCNSDTLGHCEGIFSRGEFTCNGIGNGFEELPSFGEISWNIALTQEDFNANLEKTFPGLNFTAVEEREVDCDNLDFPFTTGNTVQQRQSNGESPLSANFSSSWKSVSPSEYSTESSVFISADRKLDPNPEMPVNNGIYSDIECERSMSGWIECENIDWLNPTSQTDVTGIQFPESTSAEPSAPQAQQTPFVDAMLSSPNDSTHKHPQEKRLIFIEEIHNTQQDAENIPARVSQQSQPKVLESSGDRPFNEVATTWKHTIVEQNKLVDATGIPGQVQPVVGKRAGPLEASCAARARAMRKLGSCLRCRMLKVAVSSRMG